MNYTFVLVVILTGEIRFLSLLGLTGRRRDPEPTQKLVRRGLAIWQVVVLSERALKPRVERGGINENNNNNGFSFLVASPLEVPANFHNFTARLRSFARSLDKIAGYAG